MIAPSETEPPPQERRTRTRLSRAGRFFAGYAWLILKNIIGWAFILIAPAIGFTLPGPFGIPLFLIGFGLITFPGKRQLTARVLRGRPMNLESPRFVAIEIAAAILVPLILAPWSVFWLWRHVNRHMLQTAWYVATALVAVASIWLLARFTLLGLNILIRLMPRVRRKIRPWLRRHGILLLPPRHRERLQRSKMGIERDSLPEEMNDEILQIHDSYRRGAISAWHRAWPWIRRAVGVVLTVWVFVIMIGPLRKYWPDVKHQIHLINWGRFALASIMFSLFLLFFRAITWRRVLKGFGFKLPVWVAVRIWSTSEMARYLPGAIWQVLGRVYLIKPYGVNSVISSTSQVLELCIFLFANVLIAGSCLLWYLAKIVDHKTRLALIVAICLMPALAVLLHPKIFYGIVNRILVRIGKPSIVKRLRGWKLVKLLGYIILGLGWQSLAVFLIAQPILHLKIDWWWMVAAAYCLAWIAGFLAFWAPGGFGVREYVFAIIMQVVMDTAHRPPELSNPALFAATVILLGFLLRLWTLAGELLLWGISLLADYRGAMNQPDAPGRVGSLGP